VPAGIPEPARLSSVSTRKKGWVLTQGAFDRLLALLDEDRERAGAAYEAARLRLVKFFEWNGSGAPEEHADETINRVARKVDEGEEIRNPAAYFLGVARLLLHEVYKARASERAALDALPESAHTSEGEAPEEPRRACLAGCLRALAPESRELIVEYYREEKQAKIEWRRRLAERLNLGSLNALRIRAHRIRSQLEACVRACLARQTDGA
jgi:DNA-directed RNA polymerase specialized sigma24 family protein